MNKFKKGVTKLLNVFRIGDASPATNSEEGLSNRKLLEELLQHFEGRLKAVFDMGNFVLDGHDPYPSAYNTLKDYIAYFHIKDSLFAGAIVPPGKGEAKIKEVLDDYRKTATATTFITLEPHLQTFSGLNALVGKAFDNPYKFETKEIAFRTAFEELSKLL